MRNMTLEKLAAVCAGTLCKQQAQHEVLTQEITGAVIDSRKVRPGMLFIATKGERVDGHTFIDGAVSDGAIGVICEQEPAHKAIPYILVENSFIALKQIAEYYRKQLSIKVIGISGSVGKTSTKEFVAGVLEKKYSVLKTQGNYNNEIGLPLTVLQIEEHHEIAVLEMGISDFGEMHRLAQIARPDICVLTNIGTCHLEKLGDKAGVLKAKSEIFDFMDEKGMVCINGDDAYLSGIKEVKGKTPVKFGLSRKNDIYAGAIESKGLFGSTARIYMDGQSFRVTVPLPGAHMIYNALAAASIGNLLGLTNEEIAQGIAGIKPVGGRSNIMAGAHYTLIDDCYNANPVSMRAAIDLLGTAQTRKVAVLGDMFELGENEKTEHYEVGVYAIEKKVDVLVCIGTLSQEMYDGACMVRQQTEMKKAPATILVQEALGAFTKAPELRMAARETPLQHSIYYFPDRESFLSRKDHILQENDTILLKASHGMQFERLKEALYS